jgi:hypothetical protein
LFNLISIFQAQPNKRQARIASLTQLVSELDELGDNFQENEIIDSDDFLSTREDPKIALAQANLESAMERLRSDAMMKPSRFEPPHHLYELEQSLSNSVPIHHEAPENEGNNLEYLRTLRNYVTGLKENENRSK